MVLEASITDTQTLLKVWYTQDDPCGSFAPCAMLLCSEQGCNSVLCLRAAQNATKLIRLPPGGEDDSLMTLVLENAHTQADGYRNTVMQKCHTFLTLF